MSEDQIKVATLAQIHSQMVAILFSDSKIVVLNPAFSTAGALLGGLFGGIAGAMIAPGALHDGMVRGYFNRFTSKPTTSEEILSSVRGSASFPNSTVKQIKLEHRKHFRKMLIETAGDKPVLLNILAIWSLGFVPTIKKKALFTSLSSLRDNMEACEEHFKSSLMKIFQNKIEVFVNQSISATDSQKESNKIAHKHNEIEVFCPECGKLFKGESVMLDHYSKEHEKD
jgi:hypothetical protein